MTTTHTTGAPTIAGGAPATPQTPGAAHGCPPSAAPGTTPRVVGLDLSITSTGVAFSDGSTTLIKTRTDDGDQRLCHIRTAVAIAVGGPELMGSPTSPPAALVVIEDLPKNAKSAGITGMVQGVVRELLTSANVPYVRVIPSTLKRYATGNGNADKTAMALAAYKRAGIEFPNDKGGDMCDAWWLRAMGLDALGHPIVDLPKAQRDTLTKITWPEVVTR